MASIPPLTAEAQKIAAAERDFRLALLQATETCRTDRGPAAAGNMIQRPRGGAVRFLRATIPGVSIGLDGPEDGALENAA